MTARSPKTSSASRPKLPPGRLRALLEEALVDAYGDSEQATALFTMMEDHLAMPFTVRLLGVDVDVVAVTMTDNEEIVAVCQRGREKVRLGICDLTLPGPPPEGWEWIEAYRAWKRPRS